MTKEQEERGFDHFPPLSSCEGEILGRGDGEACGTNRRQEVMFKVLQEHVLESRISQRWISDNRGGQKTSDKPTEVE